MEEAKLKAKENDTRIKTEDVTNTEGKTFEDWNLHSDLQLVSSISI